MEISFFAICIAFFALVVPGLAIAGYTKSNALKTLIEGLDNQVAALRQDLQAARSDIAALRVAGAEASQNLRASSDMPTPAQPPRRSKALPRAAASGGVKSIALPPPFLAPDASETVIEEARVVEQRTLPPPLPATPPPLPPATVPVAPLPKRDFEEVIGTRWAVWVGGLALAVGGLFLVRYSIEAGMFGPQVRLAMAGVFAVLLVGLGEALRRGLFMPPRIVADTMGPLPLAHAPLALTGAGVLTAFGAVYAAFAVYGLLSPAVAFALMAAIGVAALAASLRHGQALAGIGLLASYATPDLVGGASPSPWPLVMYLLVITAAAGAVQNRLRSGWLGWGLVVAAGIWALLLSFAPGTAALPQVSFILGSMVVLAAAFVWLKTPDEPETPLGDPLVLVALTGLAAALGLAFLTMPMPAGLHAIAAVGAIVLLLLTAVRDGRASAASVAAALLPLGMILTWPSQGGDRNWVLRLLDGAIFSFAAPPMATSALAQLALASALVLGAVPLLLFAGRMTPKVAHRFEGLHALAFTGGLAPVLVTFAWALRTGGLNHDLTAAALFACHLVLLALISDWLYRQRQVSSAPAGLHDVAAGAYAAGAALALGLCIAFALPGLWMAVGFAIAALGVCVVHKARPLPALRRVAAALSITAVLRGVTSPAIFGEEALPILNWYIVAYGVPALALAVAAVLLRRDKVDRHVHVIEGAALGAFAALTALELRHAFHRSDFANGDVWPYLTQTPGFHETWAFALAALGFVALGLWLKKREGGPPALASITGGTTTMLLCAGLGYGLIHNPLLWGGEVAGVVIFNRLTAGYALVTMALAIGASLMVREGCAKRAKTLGLAASGLVAFWIVTQIRLAFHGADLVDDGLLGLGESGIYALALLGTCLAAFLGGRKLNALLKQRLPLLRLIRGANVAALGVAAGLCVILANPFGGTRLSGPAFIDSSFVGYLLPGLFLAFLAWLGRQRPDVFGAQLVALNRIAAIALIYFYLVVQVRRSFAGVERFVAASITDPEHYGYSLVTLAYGVGLLAIGFRLASRETRLASALFVTLAVAKVFLMDMAALTGLWRAFSFIGLGGVLIGIGVAYQRLLSDRGAGSNGIKV